MTKERERDTHTHIIIKCINKGEKIENRGMKSKFYILKATS